MLCVRHNILESAIHGLGVHAVHDIPAGTVVWKLDPSQDVRRESLEGLGGVETARWQHHGFQSVTRQDWVLCGDGARFMNFAERPNLVLGPVDEHGEHTLVAWRDIAAGDEMTAGRETDADADQKIVAALYEKSARLIERVMLAHQRPVLLWSAGKDSMVLLHLLRDIGHDIPCILHREPFAPEKYRFADRIAKEWNLRVFDYPPERSEMWQGKDILAFMRHYRIGPAPHSRLRVPKNVLPPEPGIPFACAATDVLETPAGHPFDYPFDVALIGHKSSDSDQIAGKVPLRSEWEFPPDMPAVAFPLRDWTDRDIWWYTERFNVPQQADRYDVAGRRELESKELNSDYFHMCSACVRPGEGPVVCPKSGQNIPRRADVPWHSEPLPSYITADAS